MSAQMRIAQCTREVKAAGLAGKDMTEVLAKLADAHDLNPHEIRRVAEAANREVQLELFKVAEDKRFTFKLADGPAVSAAAKKVAMIQDAEIERPLHMAIKSAGGDPFAAPVRYKKAELGQLSFMQAPIAATSIFERTDAKDSEKVAELRRAKEQLESVIRESKIAEAGTLTHAVRSREQSVNAAKQMVLSGITLPSLYEAILAAVSGEADRESAIRYADDLAELIITGLKEEGVRNYQMGFRHRGDVELLERLTVKELIALCHKASAYCTGYDLPDVDPAKMAEWYEAYAPYDTPRQEGVGGADDALALLHARGSQNGKYAVPQMYLGDNASNTPGGKIRVVNGENDFVIGIKNLVGDQRGIAKIHNAQEYLGAKLRAIEEAIKGLQRVRQAAHDEAVEIDNKLDPAENKRAMAGAVLGAVGRTAAKGVSKLMTPATAASTVGSAIGEKA